IDFTFNATSNSGISFGANVEVENNGTSGDDIDDLNVFVSGAFGTLTLGDIDSAYDAATVGIQTGGLADEADDYFSDSGLDGSATGNTILRYDYTVSGFTLSAGIELSDNDEIFDPIVSGGIDYSGSFSGVGLSVGLAVQGTSTDSPGVLGDGDHTLISVSARAEFGSIGVNGFFENWDAPDDAFFEDFQTYAGSVDYSAGPITVGANVVIRDGDSVDNQSFGAFADYDLGGGLAIVAAVGFSNAIIPAGGESYADSDIFANDGDDSVRAGLGFSMSF
ncbi:MAG: porin, partial [Pseudomonadota bacterium]